MTASGESVTMRTTEDEDMLLLLFAVTLASGQIQGSALAVPGSAVTGNKAVAGVTIAAIRLYPNPVVSGQTTSAKDGSFTIGGLPSGHYTICVTDKSGTYVDPCDWSDAQTTVDVIDGKITAAVTVRVRTSSVLQVRVNNVASALTAKPTETFPPHVLVMVRDGAGGFHPAMETAHDALGISYSVNIPFDSPLKLQVTSKQVTLETAAHAPVAVQGFTQAFQHDSTKPAALQPAFTFNAIGRNP